MKQCQTRHILLTDAQLLSHIVILVTKQFTDGAVSQLHKIRILHVIRFFVGFSIEIYYIILYLQGLTWQSHTTFYVVFSAIGGPGVNDTKLSLIVEYILTSNGIRLLIELFLFLPTHCRKVYPWVLLTNERLSEIVYLLVIVLRLISVGCKNGITCRIVEYDDVVEFYLAQALHTTIVPLWPLDVRLAVEQRHSVLCQRHGKRSLWYAWSVAHLTHKKIVASEQ